MSDREYNHDLLDYEVEQLSTLSNTTRVTFNYDGEENKLSEDAAYEFMHDFTTAAEIFGHKISVLSFKPGIKQDGSSVYLPNKSKSEAEDIAEDYISQLE